MKSVSGGEKLAAKLRELASTVARPATLKVGFLEGSTYPDGTSVAMVAAINEFGKPETGQPPRPFFRTMVAEKSNGWGGALAGLLVADDYDAAKALGRMGEGIANQLQASIVATDSPALAPATIAAKGSSKPLVDTGHMLNSVAFAVKS